VVDHPSAGVRTSEVFGLSVRRIGTGTSAYTESLNEESSALTEPGPTVEKATKELDKSQTALASDAEGFERLVRPGPLS
jgi:hypothetical protein